MWYWVEYTADQITKQIDALSGEPDLSRANTAADDAAANFEAAAADVQSILQAELEERSDQFLQSLKEDLEAIKPLTIGQVAEHLSPKGQIVTRDTIVIGQGVQLPPHIGIRAQVKSIRHTFAICDEAAKIATKAGSHLERMEKRKKAAQRVGTNVFIGHGRSNAWKDLKDFFQGRLRLPWDEFNCVPVAGITNIARLAEMLDAAAIAFLVMTAEDELADGSQQARMNVVHEAGLFQGRLGFTRAVILLEDGCEQFSNIEGLGQIRFPKDNIAAAFEEIRRVLEREGLISPA